MEAEWSVAATAEDPILIVPWQDESGILQFVDLQVDLTRIDVIPEALTWPEIRSALLHLNQKDSPLWTAKCDAWKLSDEEKQLDFGLFSSGFGAYFDVIRQKSATFSSLFAHISEAERLTTAAHALPFAEARAEFVVRPLQWNEREGYAMTIYVYGYGATDESARKQWASALTRIVGLLVAVAHD